MADEVNPVLSGNEDSTDANKDVAKQPSPGNGTSSLGGLVAWPVVFAILALIAFFLGVAAGGSGIYSDDGYPFYVAAAVLLVGTGISHIMLKILGVLSAGRE